MTRRVAAVDELPHYVDLHTVSKRTHIGYSTLRSYIASGRLPAYSANGGKTIRVMVSDVVALLQPVA
jgi:predicted site-specific integrase-resolvase